LGNSGSEVPPPLKISVMNKIFSEYCEAWQWLVEGLEKTKK
jgi:hypothetical protein